MSGPFRQILRSQQIADDGDAARTRIQNGPGSLQGNPSNGHHWLLHRAANLTQRRQSQNRIRVFFRVGGIDGADGDVVDRHFVGEKGLTVLAEDAIDVKSLSRADLEQRIKNASEDLEDAKDDAGSMKAQGKVDHLKELLAATTG